MAVPSAESRTCEPGQLFTWGRGSDGQLGQDEVAFPPQNCALPHPVRSLTCVVHLACGSGQQGCTAAVTASGELFTFGNNYKGRLGHGDGPTVREPRRVEALRGTPVSAAACGTEHSAALLRDGRVMLWGGYRHGELGRGHINADGALVPQAVELPGPAVQVDCEHFYSAVVLADGKLFTWGSNEHGKLGIGGSKTALAPVEVDVGGTAVASVSLGSLYAAAISAEGALFTWGYGGHGNLGLGNRQSHSRPASVEIGEPVCQVSCTRAQDGCKGGLNPSKGGHEGPHTVVVACSGAFYTFGTCHKGLLANLGSKSGAFGEPWDEHRPYRVGGAIRNGTSKAPITPPPLAIWPPPYDAIGPVRMAVSAHIHAAVLGEDGRAWAWGCGSNDGRCGVERFLNMKGEGQPPAVDAMKCYLMGPHRIGVARPKYWRHPSLSEYRVLMLATGRNHMACIAAPGIEAVPGSPQALAKNMEDELRQSLGIDVDAAVDPGFEAKVVEAFRSADTNGTGLFTADEFCAALQNLKGDHLDAEAIRGLFEAADANKDGMVNYQEFVAWLFDQ